MPAFLKDAFNSLILISFNHEMVINWPFGILMLT